MIAIKTDGTVWTWGTNDHGKLGQNYTNVTGGDLSSPVQIGSLTTWTAKPVMGIDGAAGLISE